MPLSLDPVTSDEMFPETYLEPFVRSPEVEALAGVVMAGWDEFRGLRDAIAAEYRPLEIAFVLNTKKLADDEDITVHTVVNVTKAQPVWRSLTGYGIVVAYRKPLWDIQTDGEKRAFLHHGLSHIDTWGGKIAIRPHPVEGFPSTFWRYGPLSLDDQMFARAASLWNDEHPEKAKAAAASDVHPAVQRFVDKIAEGEVDVTVTAGGRSATIKGKGQPPAARLS